MVPSALSPICLTAPTACGKTELSLRLAEQFPIEIISMDSAMVYRGMDIGTAKPSPVERRAIRHHLIDILDPSEAYSAGKFVDDAHGAIGQIQSRGKIPLIVGGTMLYLKALAGGLAALPRADKATRASIDEQARRSGWQALHARLARVDPAAAARIAPADRQRIQRALEVYMLTGMPLSELQAAGSGSGTRLLTVALIPEDRTELGGRIAARFDRMIADGFLDEVGRLRERGDLGLSTPAIRSVGYRQIWQYLDGAWDLAVARDKAVIATRNLAKRQLTWLRSGLADTSVGAGRTDTFSRIAEIIGSERSLAT